MQHNFIDESNTTSYNNNNNNFHSDDIIPVEATDCRIFVVASGIFNFQGTYSLLAADNIPFTVVVREKDEQRYRDLFFSSSSSSYNNNNDDDDVDDSEEDSSSNNNNYSNNNNNNITVVAMPDRFLDGGISENFPASARNFIIQYLAPRRGSNTNSNLNNNRNNNRNVNEELPLLSFSTNNNNFPQQEQQQQQGNNKQKDKNKNFTFREQLQHQLLPPTQSRWFWIFSDDIQHFYRTEQPGSIESISAQLMLRQVYLRMDYLLKKETDPRPDVAGLLPKPIGLFGLEFVQFAVNSTPRHLIANSYITNATCMNLDRLPFDATYRFRIREEMDFCLQIMRGGFCTVRFHDLSFRVPPLCHVAVVNNNNQNNQNNNQIANNISKDSLVHYYNTQLYRDIQQQHKLFIETWGSEIVEGIIKRKEVTTTAHASSGSNNRKNNNNNKKNQQNQNQDDEEEMTRMDSSFYEKNNNNSSSSVEEYLDVKIHWNLLNNENSGGIAAAESILKTKCRGTPSSSSLNMNDKYPLSNNIGLPPPLLSPIPEFKFSLDDSCKNNEEEEEESEDDVGENATGEDNSNSNLKNSNNNTSKQKQQKQKQQKQKLPLRRQREQQQQQQDDKDDDESSESEEDNEKHPTPKSKVSQKNTTNNTKRTPPTKRGGNSNNNTSNNNNNKIVTPSTVATKVSAISAVSPQGGMNNSCSKNNTDGIVSLSVVVEYHTEYERKETHEALRAASLRPITDPKVGQDVCFIPRQLKTGNGFLLLPALVEGTILEVTKYSEMSERRKKHWITTVLDNKDEFEAELDYALVKIKSKNSKIRGDRNVRVPLHVPDDFDGTLKTLTEFFQKEEERISQLMSK